MSRGYSSVHRKQPIPEDRYIFCLDLAVFTGKAEQFDLFCPGDRITVIDIYGSIRFKAFREVTAGSFFQLPEGDLLGGDQIGPGDMSTRALSAISTSSSVAFSDKTISRFRWSGARLSVSFRYPT